MKKYLLATAFICSLAFNNAFAQTPQVLQLKSNWDDNSLPFYVFGQYNDCWGYAVNGREYAILGAIHGTFFFDVTNPVSPVVVSYQPGKDTLGIHRDYKTYSHYAYAVCDEGNSSLQIFDLQYLPDSVVKVYDSDQYSRRCHNIFIEGENLYLAANTTNNGQFHAMDVLSLADPVNPTFISTLSNPSIGHVHDVFVRNDTAYCSAGNDGLFIYDYTNPAAPVLLQSITTYPEQGYNHSAWVTDDGNTLVFADETHGSGLKIYDISNLANPILRSIFRSNMLNVQPPNSPQGSIPHNPFIRGNNVVISYYHDGIQVFDISNTTAPMKVAYYDTYPSNTDYNGYAGCWGVYPYLPSGMIIGSDIENGLFILDGSGILLGTSNPLSQNTFNVYPNPARDYINITLPDQDTFEMMLLDMTGKKVWHMQSNAAERQKSVRIDLGKLAAGTYVLKAISTDKHYSQKISMLPR